MNPLTVAFAGSADVEPELVAQELDNFLPQDDAEIAKILLPEKILRRDKGLKNVKAWLDEQNIEYEQVADLVTALAGGTATAVLVLLWSDDVDQSAYDAAFELGTAASAAGIPVKDLAGGMDDLNFEDPAEDEPDPVEDEPVKPAPAEAEKPARGRGRRGTSNDTTKTAKPAEAVSEPRTRTRGKPRSGEVQGTTGPKVEDKDETTPPFETDTPKGLDFSKLLPGSHVSEVSGDVVPPSYPIDIQLLTEFIDARIIQLLHIWTLAMKPKGQPGRPHKDGSPAQPRGEEKIAFIKGADGLRKRGRGRPRRGEEAVELTRSEAEDQGFDFGEEE